MSPTFPYKYKYFHFTVQRAKNRRPKFHFCRLPFDVRPRNVKLNLSICAFVQNVRDFPETKLDSEINARFVLNEHGDPHFLFYKFNENNILNN